VLSQVRTDQKVIALTIDLGESAQSGSVRSILAYLAAHDIHCTWFVTGWLIREHPDLLAAIHDAGHDIGNHTDHHPHCPRISRARIIRELTTVETLLDGRGISVSQPKYFRPPYGEYDDHVVQAAASLGYRTVMWSATSMDYDLRSSPSACAATILRHARPGGVILTHATPVSASVLRTVTGTLLAKGYRIVPVHSLVSGAGTKQ
jgi:peptidoglycan-N-acetylglucosamine deacetylase